MKYKVTVIFFTMNGGIKDDEVKCDEGEFYLEKRPSGKFLCFKKGIMTKTIRLSKKSYKNLVRLTCGRRLDRYIDLDEDLPDDDFPQRRCVTSSIPVKKKEKAPFIIQVFKYANR